MEDQERKKLKEKINQLEKQAKDAEILRKEIPHELKNYLSSIGGFANEIKELSNHPKIDEYCNIIERQVDYMVDAINIMRVVELTKEEIRKNSKWFMPEQIAKNNAIMLDEYLKDENLRLNLNYNPIGIGIYTNESIFKVLWNTLLGNSLNYSLPNSEINQGIRLNNNHLEILMENTHNGKRLRNFGTNQGLGTIYSEKIIKTLNGNIKYYTQTEIDKEKYKNQEIIGSKKVKENTGDIWGVKIDIPRIELLWKPL